MTFEKWLDGVCPRTDIRRQTVAITVKDLRAAWAAATEAERERCAKIADGSIGDDVLYPGLTIAEAIRSGQ